MPVYLAAADILLIPFDRVVTGSSGGNSADICSPMKLFEYMATGRAIVSSDLPVIHEILNEKNAIFCPPEDLPAWKATIGELIKNRSRIESLGAVARKDAATYSWLSRAEKALANFIE